MDALQRAMLDAAEHGGGPERLWHVPDGATVCLGDSVYPQSPFHGTTVSRWSHDD